MLLSQHRIAPWVFWFFAALASLVFLPRLLGKEPVVRQLVSKRPNAVVTGIKALPDEPVLQQISTPKELQMLVPPEAEPEQETAESVAEDNELATVDDDEKKPSPSLEATPLPSLRSADVEPSEVPQETSLPKIAPAPATLEEPIIEESLPGETSTNQPQPAQRSAAPPQPELPHTTLKFAPLEEEPAPRDAVPQNLRGPAPIAATAAGTGVKYWIVSTRCCKQSHDKCGVSCRFVCHAVTEDCQCLPVCFEQVIAGQIPGAPTCVMVHGSFTRMKDVWEDSECTYRWLRAPCPQVPLNFIYFTWPSEGPFALVPHKPLSTPIPCFDFGILGRRAELNGFYLADLMGSLSGPTTVSLIGHSLGTRAIASGLHLLGGGTVHGQTRWNPADCGHRIRVIMAAAAIEHDWLNPGDRYGCALNRAECLLNLRNECDMALALYPLRRPFSGRALARSGFTAKDQSKLGDHVLQVSELDVTSIIGRGHGWPSYCRQPGISAAVSPYIFFEAAQSASQPVEVPRDTSRGQD